MHDKTPYNDLTPDLILNAVESLALRCSGSLFPLNSYENRVYQIGIEDAKPIIAKFYRPNRWSDEAILEEHQFTQELADNDIPVIPPMKLQEKTLHHFQGFRFALFHRVGGRPFEIDNPEQLEWLGRSIGRLHAVGAVRPFQHRLTLNVETYGYQPFQFLIDQDFIPDNVKQEYISVVEDVLENVKAVFTKYSDVNVLRIHGDCHAGNLFVNQDGLHIVDLDDCLMGPAIQDLWMLFSGHDEAQLKLNQQQVLIGYEEFHDFDYRELHFITPLRALRMIHYVGWLAKRWDDPAFPLAFPWFNTLTYWKNQIQDLRELRFNSLVQDGNPTAEI